MLLLSDVVLLGAVVLLLLLGDVVLSGAVVR